MAITFNNVSFTYSPKSPFEYDALFNINTSIKDGSFTAIIGHTGSGKSTLIQQMNGLLLPTKGFISFEGDEVLTPYKKKRYEKHLQKLLKKKTTSEEDKEVIQNLLDNLKDKKAIKVKNLRKKVGVVFQFPEYQLFEETIVKDVAFGPRNFGKSKEEANEIAKEMLNLVGISEEYYERSPFELSGGEKRRVAIAGILALKPEILVLDEPTAGLDPISAHLMLELFKKIHESGTTIVIVTHDMDIVLKYATDVIVLKEGHIVKEATPNVLFSDISEDYSLEVPTIYQFVSMLKSRGLDINMSEIKSIDDLVDTVLRGKAHA